MAESAGGHWCFNAQHCTQYTPYDGKGNGHDGAKPSPGLMANTHTWKKSKAAVHEEAAAVALPGCTPPQPKTNYQGYDLLPESQRLTTTDAAGCCAACTNRSDCAFWTFYPAGPGVIPAVSSRCYLKSSGAGKGGGGGAGRRSRTCQPLLAVVLRRRPARERDGVRALLGHGLRSRRFGRTVWAADGREAQPKVLL